MEFLSESLRLGENQKILCWPYFLFFVPVQLCIPWDFYLDFSPTALAFKVSRGFGFLLKLVFPCDRALLFHLVLNQYLQLNYFMLMSI